MIIFTKVISTSTMKNIRLFLSVGTFQATSTEESEVGEVTGGHRAKASAPAPNAPSSQSKQSNWSKEKLPPSEKRTNADPNSVSSCIIPINVTGNTGKRNQTNAI